MPFLESVDQNIAFFGACSLKISVYWRLRRLQKSFRVRHRKRLAQNNTNRVPSGSAGDRVPEGEESGLLPVPLKPTPVC